MLVATVVALGTAVAGVGIALESKRVRPAVSLLLLPLLAVAAAAVCCCCCCCCWSLLLQLHSSSDRDTSGFRSSRVSGCDPSPRRTPVVQRRKQSEHLFGLLLEIGRISHAETGLLLRAGTIPRYPTLLDVRARGLGVYQCGRKS